MKSFRQLGIALAALWMFGSLAFGQAARTATVVGTVTDSTGAVVPDAKVTLTNKDTAFVSNGVTQSDGSYYIPFLAVGPYELSVEAAGFKRYLQSGIQLAAGEEPRLDVKLDVGGVTESVQVAGEVPLLQTETAVVSHTIDAHELNRIPILQMKAQRILYYMIGSSSRGSTSSILGQSPNQLGYTLDGISGKTAVRDLIGDTNTNVQPDVDALAEAKEYTTGVPAEIGHAAGGMISYTFKSGTNQLHMSGEDRWISKSMIHRNYLEQLDRTYPYTYHEMMGTISGPVYIPRLYNGKNRTFFLFGYGRHHEKENDPQTNTVPDLDMLNGNFSFPQVAGGGFPIYDPKTLALNGGSWTAQPFAGNIIPKSRFDPAVVNFLALNPWQAPNTAASYSRSGPTNNFAGYTIYRSYRSRFDSKIDQQISAKDTFFVRNSYNRHRQTGRITASLNNLLLDSASFSYGRPEPINQQNWAAAEYHTFSPSLLNEMRFGYNRRYDPVAVPTANQGWAQKLGIPNVGPENFPSFGLYNVGPGGAQLNIKEDFTYQDNVTLVRSRNTFRFGYEVIRTRENNIAQTLPSGSYTFSTSGTAAPINTPNTGNQFASFLLGAVTSAAFTQLLSSDLPRWWSYALFAQTDWKPFRNVTFNLGLRWSHETPYTNKYGQESEFDPNAIDPVSGRKGAIIHPKGAVYHPQWTNFQPRIGVAWNFKPKMVFRGSWGIVTQDLLPSAGREEYNAQANFASATGDPRPVFYLSQGPPNRPYVINSDGTSPTLILNGNYSGRSATYLDPNLKVPYVMNWSGGLQFELARNLVAEGIYQGSAGVGLTGTVNYNQLSNALYTSTDPTLLNNVFNATQNYRPFTNFGTINWTSNFGHSTYHGMTLRLQKRYSNGLSFDTHWTWSKNLSGTAGDGWQFYNWRLTKALTSFDTRHQIIVMTNYDLPFGKGRKFANGGGWKNHIAGGWTLSAIYTFLSGPPLTFSFSNSPYRYLSGGPSRPNQISDNVRTPNWSIGSNRFPQSAQNPLFNQDAFAYPAPFTPGTLGASTQPGLWVIWPQWTLTKFWMVKERIRFQLRLDANNLPVRPVFTSPNTTVNLTVPASQSIFGKFAPIGTSFSTLGTDNGHFIFGTRLEF